MTTDDELHRQIDVLVAEEHDLRRHPDPTEADRTRLQALEVQLDQAWDLLRRRAALREVGQDPDSARPRSGNEVEGYLQ
jgi:hypothetical protein